MNRIFFILIFLSVVGIIDAYGYLGIKSYFKVFKYAYLLKYFYVITSIVSYVSIIVTFIIVLNRIEISRNEFINIYFGFLFAVFIAKLVYVGLLLVYDGGRCFVGITQWFFTVTTTKSGFVLPARQAIFMNISIAIATLPLMSLLYGVTFGKYKYTVEEVTVISDDIPAAFDGFRIVQISDIHAGSFDNTEKLNLGIDKINSLNPDIVCFTGDLVNSDKDEIDPYLESFARIRSKHGKYAVLGNHDYIGLFRSYDENESKRYYKDLFYKFEQMGFELLNNTHQKLNINGEVINILGVENWGEGRWFPKEGDLSKAKIGIQEGTFNLLLSHDPTHWSQIVVKDDTKIHLTLSGHTHGFQFGIDLPFLRWSPAQYRYQHWLGMYEQDDKKLYVNRGFGFLGFPGRVGMWPEITLITLKRSNRNPN